MGERFEYNYNAPTEEERIEIESIRNQYLPKNKTLTKLERLKSLDFKVKNISLIIGLTIGIIGCLIFGLGLTFFLEWSNNILGAIFGVLGILIMIPAYFVYKIIFNKLKEKYGKEILELSNELLNNNNNN